MRIDYISLLFLTGPLAAVPLGLALFQKQALGKLEKNLLLISRKLHPLAALGTIASFFFMPGHMAACLILPWLLFGALLGLIGFLRLIHGRWKFSPSLCYTAASLYLPIGAAWLFASRLGINPAGFDEPIVLLTAVHFHFSGFAASIIAAEVTYHAPKYHWSRLWIIAGTILGTPLIAAGFVFFPLLKMIAVLFFASTLMTMAAVQFLVASLVKPFQCRLFLKISSLSIFLGMTLAVIYGVTDYTTGWAALSIPQMAYFHGTLNAFGFTLCGLVGWLYSTSKENLS